MASEIYMAIITGLLGVVGFFLTRSFAALDKKADKGELETMKSELEAVRKTIADGTTILPRKTSCGNRSRQSTSLTR